jgi:hypothetical protein
VNCHPLARRNQRETSRSGGVLDRRLRHKRAVRASIIVMSSDLLARSIAVGDLVLKSPLQLLSRRFLDSAAFIDHRLLLTLSIFAGALVDLAIDV